MRKISVSEIERLLYYVHDELKGYRVPDKTLNEGRRIHNRLGYNQPEIFKRFFFFRNGSSEEFWQVIGAPDSIDYENGIIRELKTYRSPQSKEFLLEVGRSQANIYCWLTGLKKYCIDLYDMYQNKITESVCEDFNEERAIMEISEAIRRKKHLYELSRTWKTKKR